MGTVRPVSSIIPSLLIHTGCIKERDVLMASMTGYSKYNLFQYSPDYYLKRALKSVDPSFKVLLVCSCIKDLLSVATVASYGLYVQH